MSKIGVSGCRLRHRNRPPIISSNSGPVNDRRLIRNLLVPGSDVRLGRTLRLARSRPWRAGEELPVAAAVRLRVAAVRRDGGRRRRIQSGPAEACGARRLDAALQQAQQAEHDQQHRPGLVEAVGREVVQREQHAQRDQRDRPADGADQGYSSLPFMARPPRAARSRPENRP